MQIVSVVTQHIPRVEGYDGCQPVGDSMTQPLIFEKIVKYCGSSVLQGSFASAFGKKTGKSSRSVARAAAAAAAAAAWVNAIGLSGFLGM